MARAVRRVSRASTKDQKKDRVLSKKIVLIISIILVVLAGVGVGLGIYFSNQDNSEYVSEKIYFNEPTTTTDGKNQVTFNKDNYQSILRYINKGNIEHILVFIYDGNAFYADEEDEANYKEEYTKLISKVADLQYEVNLAKEADVSVELFIIDISVNSYINLEIFADSTFGAFDSSLNAAPYEPAFVYVEGDVFKEKVEFEDKKYTISNDTFAEVYSSSIPYAIEYVQYLKK